MTATTKTTRPARTVALKNAIPGRKNLATGKKTRSRVAISAVVPTTSSSIEASRTRRTAATRLRTATSKGTRQRATKRGTSARAAGGANISRESVTTFDTGAIRDTQEGKLDFIETLSFTALHRFIGYMTEKKRKYGAGNFKKGIPIDSYEKSLMRHIDKYMRNKYENGQDEPNEDHLAAIIFNVFGIMHEEEQTKLK